MTIPPRPRRIYGGDLPTARTKYVRVLVFCKSCRHQADADLQKIVLSGRGDAAPRNAAGNVFGMVVKAGLLSPDRGRAA
jgi:hypothetical protein